MEAFNLEIRGKMDADNMSLIMYGTCRPLNISTLVKKLLALFETPNYAYEVDVTFKAKLGLLSGF